MSDMLDEALAEAEPRSPEWFALMAERDSNRRREESRRLHDLIDAQQNALLEISAELERQDCSSCGPVHAALAELAASTAVTG